VKQQLNKQAGLDEEDFTEAVTRFIRDRDEGLVGPPYSPPIADTLITQLRGELAAGVRGGERLSDMQTRVRRLFAGPKTRIRAERIARTEVVGAMNRASNEAYNKSEVVGKKKWLTSRDDRVRPTKSGHFDHRTADGQIVDKDSRFEVSGELLRHPGDPLGSPGNIIRCRCAIRPVLAAAGSLAPVSEPEFVRPAEQTTQAPSVRPRARNKTQVKGWISGLFTAPGTKRSITPRTRLGKLVRKFFNESLGVVDDAFEKIGLGRRFRDKFMIPDIMDNISNLDSVFPGPGAPTASFNPFISGATGVPANTLAFNFATMGARGRNAFNNASAIGHEGFHALQWGRGWYSRDRGSKGLMLRNKEAIRAKELWLKSVDRAKIELRRIETVGQEAERRLTRPEGLSVTERFDLDNQVKEGARARVARAGIAVQQETFGSDFGNNYESGLAREWVEIEEIKSFRTDEVGIRRGYALHSPHEFGATSFEQYLMRPETLKATNLETFNFIDNYYKEGVFKRYVDYLRELKDVIKRNDH